MKYFRSDGNYIYLDIDYAEFYIPKFYFDVTQRLAEDKGSTIECLGVFDVGIFENGKLKEMKVLNLPTWIDLFVTDWEDRDVRLPNNPESSTPCRVLKYSKNHRIMNNSIIEDSINVQSYLYVIIRGKVPSNVPYEKSLQLWRKNQSINSSNLGVPSVMEELILSGAYRYKYDQGKKFSHVIGKDPNNVSQYDYVMNNVRQICQYTSTFAAVTFEDLDAMITTSLNRTRTKGNEAYSPIEALLKL